MINIAIEDNKYKMLINIIESIHIEIFIFIFIFIFIYILILFIDNLLLHGGIHPE